MGHKMYFSSPLSEAHVLILDVVGSYLFQRVMQGGKDSRFDEIKKSPPKFLVAFMAQATWISLCLMPILAVNSIPHAVLSTLPAIGITDVVGLLLYAGGLGFEVTADRQKDAWVQAKKRRVSLLSCQLLIHLFGSSEPGSFL
jgi:steroid 5-alpha reductase family enzyme